MTRNELIELGYEDVLLLDPEYLDEAIVGLSEDNRAIYDYNLLTEAFVKHDEMTLENAVEFVDYNTIRSLPFYENHPIILYKFND